MARGANHNWFDAAPAKGVEYNDNESKDGALGAPVWDGVVVEAPVVEKVEEKPKAAPKAKAVAQKKAVVKAEDDKGTSANDA